jgi:transposase
MSGLLARGRSLNDALQLGCELDPGRFNDLDLRKERRRSEACFLGFCIGEAPLPARCDEEAMMDVIHDRVAGLDVHKDTVVACVRAMSGNRATRECRTFATTTEGLLALLAWLDLSRCAVVAMEATGVYWLPVWKILSAGEFELVLANAAHIKAVPGRKTDLNDAMWIADLAAHGLIEASFVPDDERHGLRTLTRTRKQLVREQTRHVQRIQKTLTEANIRLDSALSDIMGLSGRRMIEAMIKGVRDPKQLAALASRGVKATEKELHEALHGRLTDHHRFLLELHLGQWDALSASIKAVDAEVDARVARMDREERADKARFSNAIRRLESIPGVSKVSALAILSEIGVDMSRFERAGHLIAWAGLCPSQNESAGKRKQTRLRKGAPWLKTMLVQCAWAAKRATNSYWPSSSACRPDAARKKRSAPWRTRS